MNITFALTPAQVATIAKAVAEELRQRPITNDKDAYTVAEVATMLGVHGATIRRRIQAGTIPAIPHLGAVRIPASAVNRLLGTTHEG
jgi:excisionase family DNA binding protein